MPFDIKSPLSPAITPVNVVVITTLFNVIHRGAYDPNWLSAWALTILLFLVILCLVECYYHLKGYLPLLKLRAGLWRTRWNTKEWGEEW